MRGKTIVITGATSGIGAVAAMRLAEQGARILFTARAPARADATLALLHKANNASAHQYFLGDLSLLAEQKRLAREIGAAAPGIDVLINNAGALFNRRIETADGLEKTFALNHMSCFTLTQLLVPRIAPGGRIVNVASRAHRNARLDFGDLQSRRGYVGFLVYSRSKLCNILFTRELARRLPRGITANALHPGFVATRFGDQSGTVMQQIVALGKRTLAITPEEGARTLVFLAASADVKTVSGRYFTRCRETLPSRRAQNDADAARLWEISQRIFEEA